MRKSGPPRIPVALKRIGVAVALTVTGATVAWASCGGTEGLVDSAAATMAATAVASISAAGSSLSLLDTQQTQQLTGAIAVLTKQVEVSGENSDRVNLQAEQGSASLASEIATKEVIDKTVNDFTSQGYNPCGQLSATKNMATAESTVNASIPTRIANEVDAGGGRYGSPATVLAAREANHKALYCTQSEVDEGLCSSVGAIPGGDSNASLIFSTDTTANVVAAKNAVINNIIGVPDPAIPAAAVNTPQGADYILAKKQKDAFLAFPTYSLKSIQANSEGFDGFMTERVGQYFGTTRAATWAADQASEAPRGILADMVRMQGLIAKLHERELEQGLRREANEAAELALDNQMYNGNKVKASQATALASVSRSLVTP